MPFFFLYSLISFFPLFLQGCSFYSYHTFFFPSPTVTCSSFYFLLPSPPLFCSFFLLASFIFIPHFFIILPFSPAFHVLLPCFPPSPPSSLTSFVLIPTPFLPFVSASQLIFRLPSFHHFCLSAYSISFLSSILLWVFSLFPSLLSPLLTASIFLSILLSFLLPYSSPLSLIHLLSFRSSFLHSLLFFASFISPFQFSLSFFPSLLLSLLPLLPSLIFTILFIELNIPRQRVFCTADTVATVRYFSNCCEAHCESCLALSLRWIAHIRT